MMSRFSLSRLSIGSRLFISAILCSLIILFGAGLVLSAIYRRASERAFDERLQVYVQSVAANLASKNVSNVFDPYGLGDPRFTLPLSGWYWQIRTEGLAKPEVTSSISLFGGRLPKLETLNVPAHDGTAREGYIIGPDERRLRLVERAIEFPDGSRFLVQIAGNADEIELTIQSFAKALWTSFGLLALALSVTTIFQVRFGLLPLSRLSNEIGAIRRGSSDHVSGRFPDDISPVADEINLLLDVNRDILARARTQVGNLAHALKTPLSVLINEVSDEDTPLANKVREQTGIMRDQVNWHLDRARAAARAGVIGVATDIAPAVAGLERTFLKIYTDKNLTIESDLAPDLKFRGEKQDLEEMLGNLVDNACKWARRQVIIKASAFTGSNAHPFIVFDVSDDGPGLPPEKRTEVIKRGERLDETVPGTGLGLSIVADLAKLYGGELTLDSAENGGLRALLRLPAV
ncbi:MAG: sensor histidine kinase [Beijerinckiaceae bacterium]|nr:sensor histidine kinase [Beijerinckiaceae bacterium]